MELTVKFDYSELSELNAIFIREKTAGIKVLVKQTAQGIIEIGQELSIVKSRLPHGSWLPWLDAEFGWNAKTAERFISVGCKFDNLSNLDVAPSALYLLAQNNTPESARTEAIERAESGEQITHKQAKEIVELHKVRQEQQDKIDKLESDLKSAQSMIPTEDVKQIIRDLTDEIEEFKNKPVEIKEVVKEVEKEVIKEVKPGDYDKTKFMVEQLKTQLANKQNALERARKGDDQSTLRIQQLERQIEKMATELDRYDYKKRELKALELLNDAQKGIKKALSLYRDDRGNLTNYSDIVSHTVDSISQALSAFSSESAVIDI